MLRLLPLIVTIAFFSACVSSTSVWDSGVTEAVYFVEVPASDSTAKMESNWFTKTTDLSWESAKLKPVQEFDELIYSWSIPESAPCTFDLKVHFPDGAESPWIYAGYFGLPEGLVAREEPVFDRGKLALDQLLLKEPAESVQFRINYETPQASLPKDLNFTVISTLNQPTTMTLCRPLRDSKVVLKTQDTYLDLPLRKQQTSLGEKMDDTCQTAALATALQYFGKDVRNEDLYFRIYDRAYDYNGVWPRIAEAAIAEGFAAQVERFRTWEQVDEALARDAVILCSITMPKGGDYKAPPYAKQGGHIFALNGFSSDGRVVVTDSALGKDEIGYRCQWLKEDFEKIWFEKKGGVAIVIEAPEGFKAKRFKKLKKFPDRSEIIKEVEANKALLEKPEV